MAFRVGRTPRSNRRIGRNWGRLGDDSSIVDGLSIQVDTDGQLTFTIASGQPFTQSTSGFALTLSTSTLLTVASSSLEFSDDELYHQLAFNAHSVGDVLI